MPHFFTSFKITGLAMAQIFILGAIGYFLVKRKILAEEGLAALSRLVVEIIFPVLIFSRLVSGFNFQLYADWWIFPLISLAITVVAMAIGFLLMRFMRGDKHKIQLLSLVGFQNSGYLPLAMVAALLPVAEASTVFIYIFLFLLGFDLLMWSAGVFMLTSEMAKKFELGSLFSPPVIANLISLVLISLGIAKFIPDWVMKPASMIGNCTLPLAMFVVGGNIACMHFVKVDKKAVFLMSLGKLIILPALGLWLILNLNLPKLIGLLIMIQLAMPPATSLSVIIRHYKREDLLISQGVFFGHLFSLLTIPLFLSLYFALVMVK